MSSNGSSISITERVQQIMNNIESNQTSSNKRKRLRKKLLYLQKKHTIVTTSSSNKDEQANSDILSSSPVAKHILNTHKTLSSLEIVHQQQKEYAKNKNLTVTFSNYIKDNNNNNNDSQDNNNHNSDNNKDEETILMESMKNLEQDIGKYYGQRFRLFSKFDDGILLDKESWFSVTPEKIAEHIAQRCKCSFILDAFCGAGGNTIQFAKQCDHVLSVDIDKKKLMMASHNAKIYQCLDRIDLVHSDFMYFANSIQGIQHVDAVFLSPPWGGPSYLSKPTVSLDDMTPNGFEIFRLAMRISPNIAYFLPRNIDHFDLAKLTKISKEMGGSEECEVEENYLNNVLKTITVYFGDLIKKK
ncbi:Putative PRIP-interacting protein [Heterostelium album PN500]|uniref:Trimethylguanosine synthase n=1 Tax=Heterostelium pallidum (strain ATCC 26659 / Pp 5 / PN500) TaxID=670386 RepID=D3B9I5_HETP5|nr:Putative PRIP-interacting protein [Heterostelium album PN500]EFA81897.1 Putative PRIP-interacting protein [Heterostelium album PN500]|eukprot:XP_020434014.1 Putative PRIP-interacting protein [Heterostelium album PN500]